jgi:hypothetical protein
MLPPEQVNSLCTISIHWLCHRGHYSHASPKERFRGRVCNQCTQRQSSLSDCLMYIELKHWLTNFEIQHRATVVSCEVDILIKSSRITVGIEYDGVRWHKNKDKVVSDTQKDHLLSSHLTLIRMREGELLPLDTIPYTINVKTGPRSNLLEAYRCLTTLIARLFDLPAPTVAEFSQYGTATSYFYELSIVPKGESAADLYPHLVFELDSEKTDLRLDELTPGADVDIWWRCRICDFRWKVALYHRTTGGTGCPACAGQAVSSANCISACFPDQAAYFDYPDEFIPGSNIKTSLVCSYPHHDVNGTWDNTEPICGAPMERMPISVFKQLKNSGHIWCRDCKHSNHSKTNYTITAEKNRQHCLDKKKLRIDNSLDKKLWSKLPDSVKSCILSPEQHGLLCPDSGSTNSRGKSESAILKQIV